MEFQVTSKIDRNIISQAAKLHYEGLSYRSFITLFGQEFLELIYEMLLQERLGFFVTATQGDRLFGFIFTCFDSTKLSRIMMRKMHIFFPIIIKVLLKKPYFIKNIFETFFYSSKEGNDIRPELLVMAVEKSHRSQGVGSAMIKKLDEELTRLNYKEYKVSVHQEMSRSIHFYESNNMRFLKDFILYGHRWSIYIKDL